MNFGLYSYLAAALAYGFFGILLLFSWRASVQGRLLAVVVFVSAAWAALAASMAVAGTGQIEAYKTFEILRYIAWYVFLLKLFDLATAQAEGYRRFVRRALPASAGFACLILLDELTGVSNQPILALIGHIFLALAGLAIIEQLYRNTAIRHRWAIKYLLIGTGGIFAFDFYLYADTLLFRGVDRELWEARGIIHLVAVPLLAIASVRNKNWELNVFVSRDIVLNTTAILGGGIYLLVMAAAGYYIREFGGSWGRVGQVMFFALAVALLASIITSRQLRSQARVFLGKHFYKNKYDYRVEWLRLTEKLSDQTQQDDSYKAAIEAMANTVEAREGLLWLRDEQSNFTNVAAWNSDRLEAKVTADESLAAFFDDKGFIINVNEIESRPDEYKGLQLPDWLSELKRPWLMVPLFSADRLIGFVVLANPLVMRSINWEDRDLLMTAAKQVTGYLMVIMTSDALAEAKQFEVFTRLSAYMVHDLKNIAAELELVSRNAKTHINNPDFIADAFDTVDNAAGDIKRLLDQLRNRRAQSEKRVMLDLCELVPNVIAGKAGTLPEPVFEASCSSCRVTAEKDRLANVLAHLIENAQQATGEAGSVVVALRNDEVMQVIDIRDNGTGMDVDFVRNRLFKPFDTTKGNAGMGIGMYESREFIRLLGGDIHVQSEPGKGTTISLHIPASAQHNDPVYANA
jgi:putative PEP-CTERM system histidine kinase